MCSARPANFPIRRGAATRRPTRRWRNSSRCSITTAARMAWWCRATRTATTTASCSTPSRVIRSGCAASPSPTRALRRRRCATGTKLGMRGLRFHLMEKKPGYVRGVGLDVFEVFRKTMAELGWVMQVFCDWRLLQDTAPTLARDRARHAGDRRSLRHGGGGARRQRAEFPGAAAAGRRGRRARQGLGALPHLHAVSRLCRRARAARGAGRRQSGAADVGHRLAASVDRRRGDAGRRAFAGFVFCLDAGRGGAAEDFGGDAGEVVWS